MTQENENLENQEIQNPNPYFEDDGSKNFALVLNGKVVQIESKRFPVSEEMSWIEFEGNVEVGDKYENEEFSSSITLAQLQAQLTTEFSSFLANTDWYIIRKNDPTSGQAIPQNISDKRIFARNGLAEIDSLNDIEEAQNLLNEFNNL